LQGLNSKHNIFLAGPIKALRVTEPHTPKFVGKSRNKPIQTLSAKEQEDLAVKEMEK